MNIFGLCWFMDCFNDLLAQRCILKRDINAERAGRKLETHELAVLCDRIATFQTMFEAERMNECAEACKQLPGILKVFRIDVSGARAHIDALVAGWQREFRKHQFLRVDKEMSGFVDTHILPGREVAVSFSSACVDIKEAGNCLAAECYTAAVFHLMRVSEYGLRKMATKLRVRLIESGKHQPLEFATWDKVITGCRNKIATARKLPQGPKRERRMQIFSQAADHCEYMKDIWRNEVSHARKPYSKHDAMGVLERVRAFMVFLASHEK